MKKIATFISKDSLLEMVKSPRIVDAFYDTLILETDKAGINTKERICAFFAQVLHESGCLHYVKEDLYYTAEQLMKVWPSLFRTLDFAKTYEKQPEKIANYVYGGRMGNDHPGDGWKYIGRGIIGNTGKSQYEALKNDTGIDFVSHPELLEQPKWAIYAAVNFWKKHDLNKLADFIQPDLKTFKQITQAINGGQIGAVDREAKYQHLISVSKVIVIEVNEI